MVTPAIFSKIVDLERDGVVSLSEILSINKISTNYFSTYLINVNGWTPWYSTKPWRDPEWVTRNMGSSI